MMIWIAGEERLYGLFTKRRTLDTVLEGLIAETSQQYGYSFLGVPDAASPAAFLLHRWRRIWVSQSNNFKECYTHVSW